MNNMRKLICCLVAVVLAGFALPSIGASPDKLFDISVSQSVLPPHGINIAVGVRVDNVSPRSGNSVINSLKVQVPTGVSFSSATWKTVNGSVTSTNATVTPQSGSAGQTISVSNITGIKPGAYGILTVTMNVTAPVCTASQWTGTAWAGNSFSGDPFTPSPSVEAAYVGCTGMLTSCGGTGGTINPTDPTGDDLVSSGETGILRGKDADGVTCSDAVAYSLEFSSANGLTYTAVKGPQQPSVEYIVIWDPVSADADGWAGKRPWVTWTGGTGTPTPPDWAPGLPCLIDDVSGGAAVMPPIPEAAPFNTSAYPDGSPYKYNGQVGMNNGTNYAKMCVVQHGFTVDSSTNPDQVIYWDVIIDQIDSTVKLP